MTGTPRLAMKFLSVGQAQEDFTVNEAFQTLDFATSPAVEQPPSNDPPASPAPGSCYIVGASPTGAWADAAGSLAGYSSGGWRLLTPLEGMTVYVKSDSQCARYRSGAWEFGIVRGLSLVVGGVQVVGSQVGAIASASGGSTIDTQARSAIDQVLAALRQHGLIAP
jgi:hypothetical protein